MLRRPPSDRAVERRAARHALLVRRKSARNPPTPESQRGFIISRRLQGQVAPCVGGADDVAMRSGEPF
jgi:hypothetical protein